jgi:hypothetical protein
MTWRTRLRLFWHRHRRTLQGFFAFPLSSVISPFLLTLVLTFGGFDQFTLAYLSVVAFLAWSMAYCLIGSPLLARKRHRELRRFAFACVALISVGAGVWTFLRDQAETKTEKEQLSRARSGSLVPGNGATPRNFCGEGSPGEVIVTFGDRAVTVGKFPINVVNVDGEALLRLDRDAQGNMLLSTDIYDQDHNILASIEDNKFDTDSAVFRVQRDDLSSLTVYARKDKEKVLDVRYINPRVIAVNGVFRSKRHTVVASPNGEMEDGRLLGPVQVCLGYSQGTVTGGLFGFF